MRLSYYGEIDEFLGLSDGRYFGSGYLNSQRFVDNFKIDDKGDAMGLTCHGHLVLPEIWSKKEGGLQTPHLSTIDVIEFSIECLRRLIRRTRHYHQLPVGLVRKINIVAGNSPIEGGFESIPISGQVLHADSENDVLRLEIANMVVEIIFSSVYFAPTSYIVFGRQSVSIKNVMVNSDTMTASAIINPMTISSTEMWSVSSCFAASLQLGQILLYKLDDILRTESHTLWMKRTMITFSPSVPTLDSPQPIYVRLDEARRYTKTDGDWRRADIFSIFCNTNIICSVTHRLPNKKIN